MKKWILITLLIFSVTVLSACDEGNAKDLSAYPESVQNGDISVKFYDKYMELAETNSEYINQSRESLKNRDETTDERYKSSVEEHNNYLKSVKLSPSTKVDHEINDLLQEILDIRAEVNSITLLYQETDNEDEVGSINKSLDEALEKEREKKLILSELFNKYGIR